MHSDYLFKIFGVGIDLYSIFIAIGILACLLFTIFAMKKCGYSSSARDTIIIIGIFAIMFGLGFALLFQAFYDFIADPSKGFKINGGMTFIGGLIGGVISFLGIYFLYVYVINPLLKEKSFFKSDMNKGVWYLLRIAPISITIAHAFGRIGCSFAGCCYGHVTNEWYGIWNDYLNAKTVPVQLFEAAFLFIISALMIVLLFKFNFKYNMSLYLVGYGIWRFIIEFFRGDVTERGKFIPGLSPSQFWSIIMVLAGVAIFFLYRYFDPRFNKEEESQEVETQKDVQ